MADLGKNTYFPLAVTDDSGRILLFNEGIAFIMPVRPTNHWLIRNYPGGPRPVTALVEGHRGGAPRYGPVNIRLGSHGDHPQKFRSRMGPESGAI